jgi:S1-C subfamily serine protease
MSDHFGTGPGDDEHLPDAPDAASSWHPSGSESPWTAATPSTPGRDDEQRSSEVPPRTSEVPPSWHDEGRTADVPVTHAAGTSRLRWPLVGVSLAVFGLAMGSAGFLLGSRSPSTPSATSPFGNGFTVPGFGALPVFGNGPRGGVSTSSTVPAAVGTSEKSLVDVNVTIDGSQATGAGTGIVISSGGLVLTNNHVVDGATSISVVDLGNGQTYQANVLGYDVHRDVALLQLVGASGLATASIGSPAHVGESVYAVGNAGGTGGTPTVTSGSVTGVGRSVTASDQFDGTSETLGGMLATSAALISGDSGGALTTASGTVVGVDTAGSSTREGSSGGFAVPIATALGIAQAIESGASSPTVHVGGTAMLGVGITQRASTNGAPVVSVLSGAPAAGAGITVGSRITSVAGQAVASGAGLRTTLLTLKAGQRVTVHWVDGAGTHHTASVTLASGPAQ